MRREALQHSPRLKRRNSTTVTSEAKRSNQRGHGYQIGKLIIPKLLFLWLMWWKLGSSAIASQKQLSKRFHCLFSDRELSIWAFQRRGKTTSVPRIYRSHATERNPLFFDRYRYVLDWTNASCARKGNDYARILKAISNLITCFLLDEKRWIQAL